MTKIRLSPDEKMLKGRRILNNGSLVNDSMSERIGMLVTRYLLEVGEDESGWNKLYQDPEDNRYWELTYPESGSHGGGAPQLQNISVEEAKDKYKI